MGRRNGGSGGRGQGAKRRAQAGPAQPWGRCAQGTGDVRVQGPGSSVQLTGPKACRSSEAAVGHPLRYAGVHAHQNAACGVPSSASALFPPVTMVRKYSLSVCQQGAGSFLAYMHMEGYCVRIHPHGP